MSKVFTYSGVTGADGHVQSVSINDRDGVLSIRVRQAGQRSARVVILDAFIPELIASLYRYAANRGIMK